MCTSHSRDALTLAIFKKNGIINIHHFKRWYMYLCIHEAFLKHITHNDVINVLSVNCRLSLCLGDRWVHFRNPKSDCEISYLIITWALPLTQFKVFLEIISNKWMALVRSITVMDNDVIFRLQYHFNSQSQTYGKLCIGT
jgi:hypothetical protein